MYNLLMITFLFLLSSNAYCESTCFGTTKNGRIEKAVELPVSGKNFQTYSKVLSFFGRTFVHSRVKEILVNSFSSIYNKNPRYQYVYAETGLKEGGKFRPHQTHQNGLSVDIIVPVKSRKSNKIEPLNTSLLNKWGYGVEFNAKSESDKYIIDYNSLGLLIKEISLASKKLNVKIKQVIFAPDLQQSLYDSKYGSYLKENVYISKRKSWVRHDDHIHIDFDIPCQRN